MPVRGLHTDEERASVLGLQLQGLGPSEISRRSGVALRTVERWVEAWRDVADEQREEKLLTSATELALRYQALQHQLADAYEEMAPAELVKHGANINNAMGTNLDKALAISGKSGSINVGPFLIAILPGQAPPTVDVQATDVTPGIE